MRCHMPVHRGILEEPFNARTSFNTRRSGHYYFRRRVHLQDGTDIHLIVPLSTCDGQEARERAAILAAQFDRVHRTVNAYFKLDQTIDPAMLKGLFESELRHCLAGSSPIPTKGPAIRAPWLPSTEPTPAPMTSPGVHRLEPNLLAGSTRSWRPRVMIGLQSNGSDTISTAKRLRQGIAQRYEELLRGSREQGLVVACKAEAVRADRADILLFEQISDGAFDG